MRLGIIGGTGSGGLTAGWEPVTPGGGPTATPFGPASCGLEAFRQGPHEIAFLRRHGPEGQIAPHAINYRANLWLFREPRPDLLLAVNVVGGIGPGAVPGALVIPDQLIDYTWGRAHTYAGTTGHPLLHVEFTEPFCPTARARLLEAAAAAGLDPVAGGTYGVTQGPRLETAAEIRRLARDGCTVVGMTALPEAALARELDLPYALCALVVNHAAGLGPGAGAAVGIHAQMERSLAAGMGRVARLVQALLRA
jgi:purine nucleoside phosphorylase